MTEQKCRSFTLTREGNELPTKNQREFDRFGKILGQILPAIQDYTNDLDRIFPDRIETISLHHLVGTIAEICRDPLKLHYTAEDGKVSLSHFFRVQKGFHIGKAVGTKIPAINFSYHEDGLGNPYLSLYQLTVVPDSKTSVEFINSPYCFILRFDTYGNLTGHIAKTGKLDVSDDIKQSVYFKTTAISEASFNQLYSQVEACAKILWKNNTRTQVDVEDNEWGHTPHRPRRDGKPWRDSSRKVGRYGVS